MDRRKFLQLLSGAGVSAAVATSAGFDLSHFLSWLCRKPRWSYPEYVHLTAVAEATAATEVIPASELLPELGPLMTIYYNRQAIENLKANLRFDKMCEDAAPRIFYSGTEWKTSDDWDAISLPRTFHDGTKAVKFGNIWKPVIEVKSPLVGGGSGGGGKKLVVI
jgi:hypothetical protein